MQHSYREIYPAPARPARCNTRFIFYIPDLEDRAPAAHELTRKDLAFARLPSRLAGLRNLVSLHELGVATDAQLQRCSICSCRGTETTIDSPQFCVAFGVFDVLSKTSSLYPRGTPFTVLIIYVKP